MMVVSIGWARSAGSFLRALAAMHSNVPMPLEKETARNIVTLTRPAKVNAWAAKGPASSPWKAEPFQMFIEEKS